MKAVGLPVPVHHGPAQTRAWQKRLPTAHRQRYLRGLVAKRNRLTSIVLHQRLADIEAQFIVDAGTLKFRNGFPCLAALEPHHFIAGCCQLF